MKITLDDNKINLSEKPLRNVPGALLVINQKTEAFYLDILTDKVEYSLPKGMSKSDVISIYLRIL